MVLCYTILKNKITLFTFYKSENFFSAIARCRKLGGLRKKSCLAVHLHLAVHNSELCQTFILRVCSNKF